MVQNYSHTCVHVQGTEEQEPGESVDYKGYPGWDKIDALAHALLSLKGLSIKATQVENIKQLYQNLMEFDKRPLQFSPRVKVSRLRGRFAKSRSQSGHISIDCVKRYVYNVHCTSFGLNCVLHADLHCTFLLRFLF